MGLVGRLNKREKRQGMGGGEPHCAAASEAPGHGVQQRQATDQCVQAVCITSTSLVLLQQ